MEKSRETNIAGAAHASEVGGFVDEGGDEDEVLVLAVASAERVCAHSVVPVVVCARGRGLGLDGIVDAGGSRDVPRLEGSAVGTVSSIGTGAGSLEARDEGVWEEGDGRVREGGARGGAREAALGIGSETDGGDVDEGEVVEEERDVVPERGERARQVRAERERGEDGLERAADVGGGLEHRGHGACDAFGTRWHAVRAHERAEDALRRKTHCEGSCDERQCPRHKTCGDFLSRVGFHAICGNGPQNDQCRVPKCHLVVVTLSFTAVAVWVAVAVAAIGVVSFVAFIIIAITVMINERIPKGT